MSSPYLHVTGGNSVLGTGVLASIQGDRSRVPPRNQNTVHGTEENFRVWGLSDTYLKGNGSSLAAGTAALTVAAGSLWQGLDETNLEVDLNSLVPEKFHHVERSAKRVGWCQLVEVPE